MLARSPCDLDETRHAKLRRAFCPSFALDARFSCPEFDARARDVLWRTVCANHHEAGWPRGRPLARCRLRRARWRCNLMGGGVRMRLSLRLALGLLVAACGSSGGGGGSRSAGGGGGIPPASDAGAPDAGSPDAGPAPLGG